MKTKLILTTLIVSVTMFLNAQLKVESSGRVDIYSQTAIRSSPSIQNDGLDVVGANASLASGYDLIWGNYYVNQPNNPGLLTMQSVDGAYFSVRANGMVGIFNPNPGVALEIGTTGEDQQLKVNGSIVLTSDERVKENIKDITNSLDQLKQLRTVTYNLKQMASTQKSKEAIGTDSMNFKKTTYIPKPNNAHRNHYGFLAQDVQKFFPDLVYKDSAGMLSVDYIGMIPLIVDALKSQKLQLDAQAKQIEDLTQLINKTNSDPQKVGTYLTKDNTETDALTYPVLYQNIPNPFDATTTIDYILPTSVVFASIYVYDMNGVQLKSFIITERGKGSVTIQGSEFTAGMYLYALIVDGKVIDTKRMILTK